MHLRRKSFIIIIIIIIFKLEWICFFQIYAS